MPEYHVGCGLAGIYAGTISKPGIWKSKSPVTDEALRAAAEYMMGKIEKGHAAYEISWTNRATGKTSVLTCKVVEPPRRRNLVLTYMTNKRRGRMKNPKFYTIDQVIQSSGGTCIRLPREIRVRNITGDSTEQMFEILCSFARLIPGAKIIRKKYDKAAPRRKQCSIC